MSIGLSLLTDLICRWEASPSCFDKEPVKYAKKLIEKEPKVVECIDHNKTPLEWCNKKLESSSINNASIYLSIKNIIINYQLKPFEDTKFLKDRAEFYAHLKKVHISLEELRIFPEVLISNILDYYENWQYLESASSIKTITESTPPP